MDHDQCTERLGLGPEGCIGRIGQFLAGDIRQDLTALEAELPHRALEFLRGFVAVLHRHAAERDEAVRLARHVGRDAVIEHLCGLYADLDRHSVIALRRRRHDQLHVEAHVVHVLQPLVQAVLDAADARAAIGLLPGVERLDVRRGEMRERHLRQIEMRLCDRTRGRDGDVGMDIDGGRFRPPLASGLALLARGGRAVSVGVGHFRLLLLISNRAMRTATAP